MKDEDEKNTNLVHVIKKNLSCKEVPSLVWFILAFKKKMLIEHFRIVLENDANGLDATKFMHKVWLHMIKLHWLGNKEAIHCMEWGTSKLSYLNAIKNSSRDWKVKNLLVQVCHGYEKLNKIMQGIEHNRIHWIVPFKIFIATKPTTYGCCPTQKNSPWEKLEIRFPKKRFSNLSFLKQ